MSLAHCFVKLFFTQGSKISDKSHNQETTDLHKCISSIRHRTPNHEKPNVSSGYTFLFGTRCHCYLLPANMLSISKHKVM